MEEMELVVTQENDVEVKPEPSRWYEGHISLEDAKTFIKSNIATAARSFIAIGFYLKCVRDRELFVEEDYQDIWEFAKTEYGISKSTASRYMSMNDRFSEGGNSPNIREEYRSFGKSQLQEMLYLEDEQLEQVRTGDRVEDIRSLRKPKEVPYIELPGQMEIEIDFPDALPLEQLQPPLIAPKQTFEMSVEDMLSGEDQVDVAISQHNQVDEIAEGKDQEVDHFLDQNKSIDNAYGWFRSEMVKEYLNTGYKGTNEECRITVLGSMHKVLRRKDVTVFYDISGNVSFDIENTRLEREYNYFFGDRNTAESESKEPENVPEQTEDVPETLETVIDGKFVEVPPESETPEYTPQYFLEEQKEKLDKYLRIMKGTELNPADIKFLECQKTIVAALACMVAELKRPETESEPVKQEQPELPILKNNDQRAAFIDAYETWPLWIETKETGERYYLYNLPDETSMVVKVYHARIFDYKAPGSYEDKFREGWGEEEFYLLQEGKFFRNCRISRPDLIEKLKELQKRK